MSFYRCRRCEEKIDGMGSPCGCCGTPQRVPVLFADMSVRFLPEGMSQEDFDVWLASEEQQHPEETEKFVTTIEGINLVNVHAMDLCVGRTCIIHNPTDHHMRDWELLYRYDRHPAIFERLCPHGIGHPDPDQFDYWKEASAAWRPPIDADVIDDPYPPGNPWDGIGVHGCDGCCRSAEDQQGTMKADLA